MGNEGPSTSQELLLEISGGIVKVTPRSDEPRTFDYTMPSGQRFTGKI